MKNISGGFTLTETLIATAVVGLLAAIAIPSYSYYVNSAQVSESFRLMDSERIKINQIQRNGSCTAVSGTPDVIKGKYGLLTISGTYTPSEGLSCPSGCNFSYTYNSSGISNKIAGKAISAQLLNNGKISKITGSTSIPNQYLPSTFRTIGVTAGDVCTRVKDDPLIPTTGTVPTGTATGAPPPAPAPAPAPAPSPSGGTGSPSPAPSPSGGTGSPSPAPSPSGGTGTGSGGTGTPSSAASMSVYAMDASYRNSVARPETSVDCSSDYQSVLQKLTEGFFVIKAPPDLVNTVVADPVNSGGKWSLDVPDKKINWHIRRILQSPEYFEVIFIAYVPIVATETKVYDSDGNSYCKWVEDAVIPLTLSYEGQPVGTVNLRYFDEGSL